MPFVPVDISTVKMDSAAPAPQAAAGRFAPVDINTIKLDAPQASAQPQTPPQAPTAQAPAAEPSFFERTKAAYEGRMNKAQDVATQGVEGKITTPEVYARTAGELGGFMGDVGGDIIGQGAKAAYGLADRAGLVPENVKAGGATIGEFLGEKVVPAVASAHSALSEAAPRTMGLLDAAGNIISAAGTGAALAKTAKAAAPLAKAALPTGIAKGVASPFEGTLAKQSKLLKDTADATVKEIQTSGISFHSGVGGKIANELERTVKGLEPALARRVDPVIKEIDAAVADIRGGNTNLANLFYLQESLKDMAAMGGDIAPIANAAVKKIDSVLSAPNLDKLVVSGNPQSANLISRFNKEYGQFKTHEQLSDLLQKSSAKEIKAGAQAMVDAPYFKSYNPEVQKLLKVAAKGTVSENILGAIGKIRNYRGGDIVAGGLGAAASLALGHVLPAAIAGTVVGAGAASKQIAKGTVADILKALSAKPKKAAKGSAAGTATAGALGAEAAATSE